LVDRVGAGKVLDEAEMTVMPCAASQLRAPAPPVTVETLCLSLCVEGPAKRCHTERATPRDAAECARD